jgi:hypothetical protein
MVRLWGLVKGYTPVKINLPGSGQVKVNIRTRLLTPAGEDIGTLHLNGTTVYVNQNRNITIGSSSLCDIRIKDPAVKPVHTMIQSIGEVSAKGINATVEHLFQGSRTGILTSAQETRTITDSDEPLPLGNGDMLFLPLSGENKLMPIGFRLRQTLAESIRSTLTNELRPVSQATTDIQSLEKALAKIALAEARSVAKRKEAEEQAKAKISDPLSLEGTKFKGAKNEKELFAKYFKILRRAKIKDFLLPAVDIEQGFGQTYSTKHHRADSLSNSLNSILSKLDHEICAAALLTMTTTQRAVFIKMADGYEKDSAFGKIAALLPK